MDTSLFTVLAIDQPMDCFGNYNKNEYLCAKHCVLRLRCAIEQEQILRSALLEELIASENTIERLQ